MWDLFIEFINEPITFWQCLLLIMVNGILYDTLFLFRK